MRCLNAGTLRASEARHIIAHMAYVAAAAQEKEVGHLAERSILD
jgi:hypothetical protein